ncbi:MAG: SpoIIIAC/SpoIIIAD family protein [Lachnospiraceae bacterium]|nr:SpoIIIAC/SpoIIIAD family protein [Lachnospiraceae bacterium]
MEIVRVGVLGLIGVLFATHLRQSKPEYSYLITFGICIAIFLVSLRYVENLLLQIGSIRYLVKDNGSYYKTLLKVIGITYICEFCAEICSDAGYKAIAGQIEVFGKITILLSGMPILLALLETMHGFIGG